MKKTSPIYYSIFFQAALIVVGFTAFALALSTYLFHRNMKTVLMNEAGKKATIFLAGLETQVRRSVLGREPHQLSELLKDQMNDLAGELNFIIIRGAVLDAKGRTLDHTRAERIGQIHSDEDFRRVMATGEPLLRQEVKVLKEEPGMPEIAVITVVHPVRDRKGVPVGAIKLDLDVSRTLDLISEEISEKG